MLAPGFVSPTCFGHVAPPPHVSCVTWPLTFRNSKVGPAVAASPQGGWGRCEGEGRGEEGFLDCALALSLFLRASCVAPLPFSLAFAWPFGGEEKGWLHPDGTARPFGGLPDGVRKLNIPGREKPAAASWVSVKNHKHTHTHTHTRPPTNSSSSCYTWWLNPYFFIRTAW